ncbi:hypothetical protein L916_02626 [Phytophthora nicotianae]|uniref:RxLR effector protein n=1 Tax=Phytophthora nicotianae TaxID=4792 RepID=W2JMP7_PHYNI|nr:hypothetical protein L916_02626 [Phytophthora nicotianae]
MGIKTTSNKCLYGIVLLSVVVVVAQVSVLAVSVNATVNADIGSPNSNPDKSFQAIRRLRTVTTDDRGLGTSSSTIAELVTQLKSSSAKATKKFLEQIKGTSAEAALLQTDHFIAWSTSLSKSAKKKPEVAEVAMVSSLAAHYGDVAVAKMLTEAKKTSHATATTFINAQLTNWHIKEQSADDVFKLLRLHEKGEKLFEDSLVSTWILYVTKLNKDKASELMFKSLKTHYSDEVLAKLIVAARSDYKFRQYAVKWQDLQLVNWLNSGQTSDDVFKLLKLNVDESSVLTNPALNSWVRFTLKLEKEDPYEKLFAKLTTQYDDASLAKLLIEAKGNAQNGFTAGKLEALQFVTWKSKGKSAEVMFKSLKLDQEGSDLLKNPIFNTWISYVDNSDAVTAVLRKRFEDDVLAKMAIAAKNEGSTRSTGTTLENALLTSWESEGKTADDVFELVQLSKAGDEIFTSLAWNTWTSYIRKLDKENPDEQMYLVLKNHFGDDGVVSMIVKAKESPRSKQIAAKLQEEVWRAEGKTSDDIFRLLKLNEESYKVLENPALSTWVSYVTKLGKLDQTKPSELRVIMELEKRYTSMELARMIVAAMKNGTGEMKTLASDLQELLFKHWLAKKLNPQFVVALMGTTDDWQNLKVILNYTDFYWKIEAA